MIFAEAHSDDWKRAVRFDATRWFETASNDQILALAACGWGGDYPADAVAEDLDGAGVELEGSPHTLSALFGYLPGPIEDLSGFECHVDHSAAIDWIKDHRPHLLEHILDKEPVE